MNALKLHHQDTIPARRLPEWLAPASRVFLGLCLLAAGLMIWLGAHDLLLATAAGRSFEEARREDNAVRAELNRKVTALMLKLDKAHDPD